MVVTQEQIKQYFGEGDFCKNLNIPQSIIQKYVKDEAKDEQKYKEVNAIPFSDDEKKHKELWQHYFNTCFITKPDMKLNPNFPKFKR